MNSFSWLLATLMLFAIPHNTLLLVQNSASVSQILGQSRVPTNCDTQAQYVITIDRLDVEPYPLEEDKDVTFVVRATGNRDAILKALILEIRVGFIKIPLYYELPDQFKDVSAGEDIEHTIKHKAPRVPIPLKENQITVLLQDQDDQIQYCGHTTGSIDSLTSAHFSSSQATVYQCEFKEYALQMKDLRVLSNEQVLTVVAKVDVSIARIEIIGESHETMPQNLHCRASEECALSFTLQNHSSYFLKIMSSDDLEIGCVYTVLNSTS